MSKATASSKVLADEFKIVSAILFPAVTNCSFVAT
jgi:hypothetical protein